MQDDVEASSHQRKIVAEGFTGPPGALEHHPLLELGPPTSRDHQRHRVPHPEKNDILLVLLLLKMMREVRGRDAHDDT